MTASRRTRRAIYTRKSTDEGLEQEFNSLDAQREACGAFIHSQRHEGWQVITDHYDDGGYSGGTMDRPALAALLDAVRAGRIDVVVVYKIDRLTRSLMDFARIVDCFDQHRVSFVSVTQAFNTTSSMGRLTLKVLLSFAQFEREVTAERIRDKIAASKKKGIWMGGRVPLGYDVVDRELVVNASEAETVRTLFRLYLECGTVRAVQGRANALGLATKLRRQRSGQCSGGASFSRGHLSHLLSNPIYVGRVPHRGASYPGRHQALVDEATSDAIQARLSRRRSVSGPKTRANSPSLLAGLLYDETGDRLSPSHANKGGRRYRYYISHRLMRNPRSDSGGWRLPARELERAVIATVAGFLRDEPRLMRELQMDDVCADDLGRVFAQAARLGEQLTNEPADIRERLGEFVERIEVAPGRLTVTLDSRLLRAMLGLLQDASAAPDINTKLAVTANFALRRRGVETRLVMGAATPNASSPDQGLVAMVAKAHDWFETLAHREVVSIKSLAQRDHMDPSDATRLLRLTFLAPDFIEAILEGSQPVDLTARKLRRLGRLPLSCNEQRRALGFADANY